MNPVAQVDTYTSTSNILAGAGTARRTLPTALSGEAMP